MKLNFWQWVGVALIVVAIIVYFVWDRPRRLEKKEREGTARLTAPADATNALLARIEFATPAA